MNVGVAQPDFAVVTITADAAAVSLGAAIEAVQTLPTGPLAWLTFVSDVILYLGTPNNPPTGATLYTLAGTVPFTDVSSGIPSDQGPNLFNYMVYTTGAGNASVQVAWRTR